MRDQSLKKQAWCFVLAALMALLGLAGCAGARHGNKPAGATALEAPATSRASTKPVWQRVRLFHQDKAYDFPVYANHPLDGDLSRIEKIVVIQHGILRNGAAYYAAGAALLQASGADPAKVLLLAPEFPATRDRAKGFTDMPLWRAGGPSNWAAGNASVSGAYRISSMQVFDDLLQKFTDRQRLPALTHIVLAGHSAGAQFMQRYAALNNIDEGLRGRGIDIRYVIANPSSYLYFTGERPQGTSFAAVSPTRCAGYDDYRYGMRHMVPYGQGHGGPELFRRYAARHIAYLLGTADNDPNHRELDKTCGAQMQGPTRLQRGLAYLHYERYLDGAALPPAHAAYEVLGVGHHQAKMFGSRCGMRMLFGASDGTGAQCRRLASAQ